MERLKNKALWLAVAGFIPMLGESLEVYDLGFVLPGNWDQLVTALLGILVLAGILNNPSKGTGFKDKEVK